MVGFFIEHNIELTRILLFFFFLLEIFESGEKSFLLPEIIQDLKVVESSSDAKRLVFPNQRTDGISGFLTSDHQIQKCIK